MKQLIFNLERWNWYIDNKATEKQALIIYMVTEQIKRFDEKHKYDIADLEDDNEDIVALNQFLNFALQFFNSDDNQIM